jgi:hypothetical protein
MRKLTWLVFLLLPHLLFSCYSGDEPPAATNYTLDSTATETVLITVPDTIVIRGNASDDTGLRRLRLQFLSDGPPAYPNRSVPSQPDSVSFVLSGSKQAFERELVLEKTVAPGNYTLLSTLVDADGNETALPDFRMSVSNPYPQLVQLSPPDSVNILSGLQLDVELLIVAGADSLTTAEFTLAEGQVSGSSVSFSGSVYDTTIALQNTAEQLFATSINVDAGAIYQATFTAAAEVDTVTIRMQELQFIVETN